MTPASKIIAQQHRRAFEAEFERPEEEIRLDVAALLVGAEDEAYLELEVEEYLRRIAALGQQARERLAESPQGTRVEVFNHFMFEEVGLHGNAEDYYDPRNSFLHRVLDRRTGIPITLSVIYMLVGREAGLEVEGIGLPGHFIVRAGEREMLETVLVDPFRGTMTTLRECQERLDQFYEDSPELEEEMFVTTTRLIVMRMLLNLKAIYLKARLYRQALAVVERMNTLTRNTDANGHKERGELLAQLGRLPEAVSELQAFLNRSPEPQERDEPVREQLRALQRQMAMRN
jgi:regulator of sirC expression with transglutaminase-like and TPR domain